MGLLQRLFAEVKAIQRHQKQWAELDLGMSTSCQHSYIAFWIQHTGFHSHFQDVYSNKARPTTLALSTV
jgi:hypothetical protein